MFLFILCLIFFAALSILLFKGYFQVIGLIKNRSKTAIFYLLSFILYFFLVVFILFGALFPVWLGKQFNVFQSAQDILYMMGLWVILSAALFASKLTSN